MTDFPQKNGLLTHSQIPILLGQRLNAASPLYNMAFAFVIPAELDTKRFQQAWNHVAASSDALRTRIPAAGEGGISWRLGPSTPATEIHELDAGGAEHEAFLAWARHRCRQPMDLSGHLLESVLVPLRNGQTGWYLNQHHLITDAWSTRLVVQRVSEAYLSLIHHGALPETDLDAYYTVAASQVLKNADDTAAKAHWQELANALQDRLELYGRPTDPGSTESTRVALQLDEERSDGLRQLARSSGFASLSPNISEFNLFATLLAALLHRISDQEVLGFDAPSAGRSTPEARRSIGCYIELFPYHIEVRPGDSFRELAARCLGETLRFLSNARPGTRDLNDQQGARVVLNYLPMRFEEIAGQEAVETHWLHPGHSDSSHALRLQVHDFSAKGRWSLLFDCNDDALPLPYRNRIPEHFMKLLDALLENPDRPLGQVDLLLDEERVLLNRFNDTAAAPLPAVTLVDRITASIDAHADRVALREGDASLNYAELGARVDQVTAALAGHGIGPGHRVVVTGNRSMSLVIAILAVMKRGAAYVPVDAATPPDRLTAIVRNAGATAVMAGRGAPDLEGLEGASLLSLDPGPPDSAQHGAGLSMHPSLDDEAYLIYTSGSTGTPKGVVINHLGLADYLSWAEGEYVRGEFLRFPLFTSIAFDLTVTSLFLPLVTGGTLDIYPEPGSAADTAVFDVADRNRVDVIKLTPSHLQLLVRQGMDGSRIRRMILGGENLTTRTAAAASAQLMDRVEITNEYGPTEAVVGCIAHRYDPTCDTGTNVPIGVPAAHVTVEILNDHGSPAPLGTPGELWLSRPGLALRYEGMEALTSERFPPHPDRPGRRHYRTGDRVRLGEDGQLHYLGRLDRQLKISGHRIEPAEIEQALRSIDGVTDCTVIAHRHHAPPVHAGGVRTCVRCGLASNVPRTFIDVEGVCNVCRTFEQVQARAEDYFLQESDLEQLFEESRRRHAPEYDCMMLYSGGKDSSYALARLVGMGLKVYAFTLDNGFISDDAKANIRGMTEALNVPVEFATTPHMNAIFRDSLERFSNVCNGCFKTIYTLSVNRAHELGIPIIVTGLSRGQMFETRLTEEMFRDGQCSPAEVDAAVLAARKVYHRVSDEVTRTLDTQLFETDKVFEAIQFVDFYRYVDVGLDEVYRYLDEQVPWTRPRDTGRSTNCLINDVGISIHQAERGFHNYALPYSWDVRMGHKTRDEALDELNDEIEPGRVQRILREIGYQPRSADRSRDVLEAFYVSRIQRSEAALRSALATRLPAALIPSRLVAVEHIPLTTSGKIDEHALLARSGQLTTKAEFRAPEGPVESYLADLWQRELMLDRVSADDQFFELGGTSLMAMQVMLQLCEEFHIKLPLETLFMKPVLSDLARAAEDRILADIEGEDSYA